MPFSVRRPGAGGYIILVHLGDAVRLRSPVVRMGMIASAEETIVAGR